MAIRVSATTDTLDPADGTTVQTTERVEFLNDPQNFTAYSQVIRETHKDGSGTYIPLATRTSSGRFGYLALLMDLYSRRIVGWEYGTSMCEDLVLGALRRAIQERQPDVGLIHHTDRGGQYASRRYRDVLMLCLTRILEQEFHIHDQPDCIDREQCSHHAPA